MSALSSLKSSMPASQPSSSQPIAIPFPELTPGQRRVALVICCGVRSREERALLLDMNRKTVDSHRRDALSRLGLASDVQLLRYAVLKGYMRVDSLVDRETIESPLVRRG